MKLSSIFVLLTLIISFYSTSHAEQISAGKFVFIRGEVTINRLVNSKLTQIKAQLNDLVYKSDTIETTSTAAARVRLVDSNQIDIYPKTKVSISEYIYKPAENKKNVELSIDSGKVQSTVRQKYDGTKNTYRVKTPGIVAGVRGTIFTVGYESGISSASVIEGLVDIQINNPNGSKATEGSGALVRPQQKIQFMASQQKIEATSLSKEDIEKNNIDYEIFKDADEKSKTDSIIEADKSRKLDQTLKPSQKDSQSKSNLTAAEQKSKSPQTQNATESTSNQLGQNTGLDLNTTKENAGRAAELIRSDRAEEALQNAQGQQIKEDVSKGLKGSEKSAADVSAERRNEALQKKLKELNSLTQTTNAETKANLRKQAEDEERRKAEAAAAAEAARLAEEARKKAEEAAAKEKTKSSD